MPDPNRFAEGYGLGQQILEQRGKKRGQEFLRSLLSSKEYAFSQVPGGLGYLGGLERLSATEEAGRRRIEAIPEELRPFLPIAEEFGQETARPFMRKAGVLPEKEPTVKEMMGKQEKVLLGMLEKGEFTAQNYKEKLSPFAQRRVEEMKLFPGAEKPKKPKVGYKPTESEKTNRAIAQARKGLLKDPQLRIRVERAGFDPDTGKELFDAKATYKEYLKWKEDVTADRLYRKDPQTGKLLDIEKTEEELMGEFAKERLSGREQLKKAITPQTKTVRLVSQYKKMLKDKTHTKAELLQDLIDSADYYRKNGVDIEKVKSELGL